MCIDPLHNLTTGSPADLPCQSSHDRLALTRLLTVMGTILVSAASAVSVTAQPLASKGSLAVTLGEAKSAAYYATPEQQQRLIEDPMQWRPIAEETLTVREWLQSPLRSALTAEERAAVEYRTRLADLRAGIDALVQRDLVRLRSNDNAALEARARDLWLADDGKYFTPTSARVNLLFIDAQKRGLKESTARYQQATRRLKRGESFAKVAIDLGDIVPGQKAKLPVPMKVELRAIEGAARRAIFRDLKLGELSSPIPTPEGWVVVQVLEIQKPKRQPFADVKTPIMEDILADASTTARMAIMAKLADPPVVYAKEISPDPVRERTARAAASAAAQLAQEMSQRNMTAADAQRRLQELLELAKQSPTPESTPAAQPLAPAKQ